VASPRKLTTSGRDRGLPLADFLAERLHLPRPAAVSLIRRGSAYIGRRRTEDPEHILAAGERVTVYTGEPQDAGPAERESGPPSAAPGMPPARARAPEAAGLGSSPADRVSPGATAGAASAPGLGLRGSQADPTAESGSTVQPSAQPRDAHSSQGAAGADDSVIVVVHEDDEVLVVEKPIGVASQAARDRAADALDRLVARRDPGARLLHRLDRDASGLVLFTRTGAARRRLAALLDRGAVERRYAAVAWGHLAADAGVLDRPIGPDPRDRRRMSAGAHGRPALTRYRVVRRGHAPGGSPTTLVELDLATGRTHQIRVHLAAAGHPLCGDRLYGPADPPEPIARLCLHAIRLAWPGAAPVESPRPALFDGLVGT
jgi:RluA family pseudouridine synthase